MGGGGAVEGGEGSAEETDGTGLEDGRGDVGQDAEWVGRTLRRRVVWMDREVSLWRVREP